VLLLLLTTLLLRSGLVLSVLLPLLKAIRAACFAAVLDVVGEKALDLEPPFAEDSISPLTALDGAAAAASSEELGKTD